MPQTMVSYFDMVHEMLNSHLPTHRKQPADLRHLHTGKISRIEGSVTAHWNRMSAVH